MGASDTGNVTGPVTTPVAKASSVADPEPVKVGSVRLRGVSVSLDTDVGQAFVVDCCRHTEGLLSDSEIKSKWALERRRLGRAWPITQLCSKLFEQSVSVAFLVVLPRERRRCGTLLKRQPSSVTFLQMNRSHRVTASKLRENCAKLLAIDRMPRQGQMRRLSLK